MALLQILAGTIALALALALALPIFGAPAGANTHALADPNAQPPTAMPQQPRATIPQQPPVTIPQQPPVAIPTIVPPLPEILVEAPEPRYAAATRRDRIGRVWAPVYINGQGPFRLVLDTGANRSAIISSVAVRLGIPILTTSSVQLHGATGSAFVPTIKVDKLEVGDLDLPGSALPIVADAFGGAEGVLGNDGFAERRILIDFANDLVSITRSHNLRAPPGFSSIPVNIIRGRLLSIDVRIGQIRTKAIIDTGAQQTIGNLALRDTLTRHRIDNAKPQDIIGVTLDVARGQSVATPTVAIGTMQIDGLHVTFGEMFIFEYWKMTREPAMLIGMDILGSVDSLIIDYKRRELQIRPRVPGRIYP